MPVQLESLGSGPNLVVDRPILLIGRHPECDIQIDSRKISRRHCCLAQVSDYLVVRDLGSTNGIRINGVRVLEGRLRDRDELTIGANRYRVVWENAEEAVPDPGSPPRPLAAADDDAFLEGCEAPVPIVESLRPAPRPDVPAAGLGPPRVPPLPLERPSSRVLPGLPPPPGTDPGLANAHPSSHR